MNHNNKIVKFSESSIKDLIDSAVSAYPKTELRQHATHPVVVKNLHWTPFIGMKTLFVRGLIQNEDREYDSIILFKNLNFNTKEVKLYASNGLLYEFEQLDLLNTHVVCRCNCPDFKWRFSYYNHVDESLYGRKPSQYQRKTERPPANPKQMPGMCKHLMKMQEVLQKSNLFK